MAFEPQRIVSLVSDHLRSNPGVRSYRISGHQTSMSADQERAERKRCLLEKKEANMFTQGGA